LLKGSKQRVNHQTLLTKKELTQIYSTVELTRQQFVFYEVWGGTTSQHSLASMHIELCQDVQQGKTEQNLAL
jgi:hypothetical protein